MRSSAGGRIFPYRIPCIISLCYCKDCEEEEVALRLHPKCLYTNPPLSIVRDWDEEVVRDRVRFIVNILERKKINIAMQNVKLCYLRLVLRLVQGVQSEKQTSCTVIKLPHLIPIVSLCNCEKRKIVCISVYTCMR
jgi:hypothetical protein